MNKEFVSWEIAKQLKDLGFNEICFTSYNPNKDLVSMFAIETIDILEYPVHLMSEKNNEEYLVRNSQVNKDFITAPLYQQVIRWLWEEHKIFIKIFPEENNNYSGSIKGIDKDYGVYNYNYEFIFNNLVEKALNFIKLKIIE